MEFEASIELDKLHDALEALSVLSDEAKFVISKDGITSSMRDPANIADVFVNIKKEAFISWGYHEEPGEIALINLADLVDTLSRLQEIRNKDEGEFALDEGMKLTIDEPSNKLLLSRGGFTYRKFLADPVGIRGESINIIDSPVEIRVGGTELWNALHLIQRDSDYPSFDIKDGKLVISTGVSKENTSPQTEYEIEPLNVVTAEVHSLFSMDYLSDLKKPISKAKTATMHMGNDFPIKIGYSLYSGSIEIEYRLAPRVDPETEAKRQQCLSSNKFS